MKTTSKQKLKKILFSGVIAITLVFSNFFGLTSGLVSMFAFADYKAEKYTSFDFETSSSWSVDTNFLATDDKPFKDSNYKLNLATSTLDASLLPATKYDGVSIKNTTTNDKAGNVALYISANNAPSVQTQTVKENNKVVFDKENFVSFESQTLAEESGNYKALKVSATKWVRLFDPTTISSSNRDQYSELTAEEKQTVEETYGSNEYNAYLKKYVEKTHDVDIYYGFKSPNFKINNNAYYVVTFWAFTPVGTKAEIQIKGTNYKATEEIETESKWHFYTIFIAGKSDGKDPTTANIYYYLGTSSKLSENASHTGFAILDDIVVKTINQTDFNQRTINGTDPIDGENKKADDSAEVLNAILSDNKVDGYMYTSTDATVSAYSPRIEVEGSVVNGAMNEDFNSTTLSSLYRKDSDFTEESKTKWTSYIPLNTADDSTTTLTAGKYNEYVKAYTAATSKISQDVVKESEEFQTGTDPVVPAPDTFNPNNYILKLVNSSASLSLGYSTNAIKINQLGYYRVSLWLKATDENASATVKMYSDIKIGTGDSHIIKAQPIKPHQTTSDATNNWMEVIFYVKGNAYHDYNAYLAILADSKSTIYVDNIKVEQISSSAYSSGGSTKQIDLALSTSMPASGITNGFFTTIETNDDISSQSAPYATPTSSNWTFGSDNTKSIVKGIVPTTIDTWVNGSATTEQWDSSVIGGVTNPNLSSARTNVYAIYAPDADSVFTMTSASFTLKSSTVYKIFFSVYADANASGKVVASLGLGSDEIVTTTIDHSFNTKGTWTTYAIYVRVDDTDRSLKFKLAFTELEGTMFVKDVRHIIIADIKEADNKPVIKSDDEQFAEAMKNPGVNTYFLDFMSESFTEYGKEITTDRYESLNYKLEELDEKDETVQGTVDIIFTNKTFTTAGGQTLSIDDLTPNDNISNKVLFIENTSSEMVSTITPNIVHSLSKSSFYTLTFKVKTSQLEDGKGLTIKINSLAIAISNVDTTKDSTKNEDDGFRTYSVYIRTSSTNTIPSTYVGFELTGKGYALIADIALTKLADEAAYTAAINGVTEDAENYIKDYYVEAEEKEKSTPEPEDNNGTLAIFFYILSSLLLVAAIVVALVATFAKKHPIKKRVVGTNKADIITYNKDGKPVSKRKAKNDADKGGFV